MLLRTPKTPDFHTEAVRRGFNHFSPAQVIGGYRARYPASYRFTRGWEGGYVNDPDDPGGCTNMGITIGTLRAWRDDSSTDCEDVYNLSSTEAGLIYASNYWAPVWGNQLPVGINCQVWDFGVNAGPSRAVRYLQMIVGTTEDGIMGPATLAAAEDADQAELLQSYHDERQRYYESLSTFSKYGTGWTNRNSACYDLSVDLLEGKPDRPSGLEARVSRLETWAGSFG